MNWDDKLEPKYHILESVTRYDIIYTWNADTEMTTLVSVNINFLLHLQTKGPIVHHSENTEQGLFFGLELPVLLALVGSLAVLLVASAIFALLIRKDISSKRKMQGLSSAADIDAEATRDYQELCRARMSGKWTGQQTTSAHPAETPQRITSLSREPEGNSQSTRSSTSSW